ncbi:hypothetical protein Tco_0240776 [Tanacetum coccineum]
MDSLGRVGVVFTRCFISKFRGLESRRCCYYGYSSLSEDDFYQKETIVLSMNMRPPDVITCNIFGLFKICPKKVVSPPIVATSNVVTPNVEKTNDGFQTVGKKKKRKVQRRELLWGYMSQSTPMLKTIGNSSKKDNLSMSNSFSALNKEEDEEDVENVYDESANLIQNTKAGGSSSFTDVVG